MGFLAPAVPWIIKGGAMLGSSLLGKKAAKGAQNAAMARSPEEQTALGGAQTTAGNLGTQGGGLVNQGQQTTQGALDTLQQPTNYWSKLLGGNRAQMSQATAGAKGSITDIYSGAARNLERSNVRGAARDVQKGELAREQAGKIAGLTTGVQPAAAEALSGIAGQKATIGAGQTSQGANMQESSGNLFSSLLGQGFQNRAYGRGEGEKAGNSIGGFLFDAIRGIAGSKWPGGSKQIPSITGTRYGSGMGTAPAKIPTAIF